MISPAKNEDVTRQNMPTKKSKMVPKTSEQMWTLRNQHGNFTVSPAFHGCPHGEIMMNIDVFFHVMNMGHPNFNQTQHFHVAMSWIYTWWTQSEGDFTCHAPKPLVPSYPMYSISQHKAPNSQKTN